MFKPQPLSQLPATALREVFKEGYTAKALKRDVIAGVLVGIVAIPLSMALAIAVGVSPERGLYTAIIAGFLTALLGGSRIQIAGPTAAFIVILTPILARFGLGGLLLAGMLAGLILMFMGIFRLGRLIEFIPFPVTTGFTAGIGTVIATLQIKDFLGMKYAGQGRDYGDKLALLWQNRNSASFAEFLVGLCTLLILLAPRLPKRRLASLPKALRKIPAPLFALPLAALLAWYFSTLGPGWAVETVGSRFHSVLQGVTVPGIPRTPPGFALPWWAPGPDGQPLLLSFGLLRELFPSAIAIALLGAIESLLSAVVADGMARTRHNPNAELLALGVANLVTPFFGGIAATGAIARTATNYRFGGRSPVAAMVHALTVLLGILLLAPLISYLPMASMAALLLLVAWNMADIEQFIYTTKAAPSHDVAVLWICFGLTVIFDMVIAVSVGVVLASLLFMGRMASETQGRFADKSDAALPGPLPEGVLVYDLIGPLFFGAAERAMQALRSIASGVSVVVFRFEGVSSVDITGIIALEGILEELERHGMKAIFVGMRQPVEHQIKKSGLAPSEGKLIHCRDLKEAYDLLKSKSAL